MLKAYNSGSKKHYPVEKNDFDHKTRSSIRPYKKGVLALISEKNEIKGSSPLSFLFDSLHYISLSSPDLCRIELSLKIKELNLAENLKMKGEYSI